MPKIQENARILSHEPVARQTYVLRLLAPEIARRARAGQFLMLQIRRGVDPLLRRPLSFHRIHPEEGVIEVLYRVVGRGTGLLSQAQPQSEVSLIGPLGNGFTLPGELAAPPREASEQGSDGGAPPSLAVLAGGIGIAPLRELLVQLTSHRTTSGSPTIHLFYGARTAAEFLPAETLSAPGVTIHWSTDDGSLGYQGTLTRLFQETVERERLRPSVVYACGPLAMQVHVAKWAIAHGVPAQLSLESLMACGIGACLGCALPARRPGDTAVEHYVHVCKDGPIFDAGAIQWSRIQSHQPIHPIFLFS